jgi:hypothetical protein
MPRFRQLSLRELSPVSIIPKDHLFVAFKSYFDGGNEADSTQYKVVTLASFSGSEIQWRNFEQQWLKALEKHNAEFLHTTDAVGLTGKFSKRDGWTETKRDAFIADCVSVIERCAVIQKGGHIGVFGHGVRPHSVSVILDDFKRAAEVKPDIGTAEYNCAIQSGSLVFHYGEAVGARQYQFYFDRNERFYGHIRDRVDNKKSRQHSVLWKAVVSTAEVDMRHVPALQACDLLAWSINHEYEEGKARFPWQARVLKVDRCNSWYNYERLINPVQEHIDIVKTFKLPRRKPTR